MKQTYLFPDAREAGDFVEGYLQEMEEAVELAGRRRIPQSDVDNLLRSTSGRRFRSSHGKENIIYNYPEDIFHRDREYLYERDPLTHGVLSTPARDTWSQLPTLNSPLDEFFLELAELDFPAMAETADTLHRRDGSAFLYLNAGGSPRQPLRTRDELFGFDIIKAEDVTEVNFTSQPTALTGQHGIRDVTIDDPEDAFNSDEFDDAVIHGSRLVLFKEDRESRGWRGRPVIDPIHDALWNLRDIEYAQSHAQFEGSPLAVEVVPDVPITVDEEDKANLRDEIVEFTEGTRQAFSPVEGVSVERVESADLGDPMPVARMLTSRVAAACEFTVNQLLAMSRGAEQVTDTDRQNYETNIQQRRETFARPILSHMITVGDHLGMTPQRDLRLPLDVRWPNIQAHGLRAMAYIYRTMASALDIAEARGKALPPEIEHFFPDDPSKEPDGAEEPPDEEEDEEGGTGSDDVTQRELVRELRELNEKMDRL